MKSISNVDIKNVVRLKEFGFKSIDICSPFEVLRLSLDEPKAVVIYFSSKKLLIQTSKKSEQAILELIKKAGISFDYETIKSPLREESEIIKKVKIKKEKNQENEKILDDVQKKEITEKEKRIIGSDECLKGDSFGGIVVCAVYADNFIREKLIQLGVRDSKELTDDKIIPMAKKIMSIAKYHVENIYPSEFNRFELTPLLNRLHKLCYEKIIEKNSDGGPAIHIVDKYPGCNVGDFMFEKAESKYVEVAAASIIARYFALMQIDDLSRIAGFNIPLGSTHVLPALLMLKKSGLDPNEFVKISFSNVRKVFFEKK